MRSGHHVYENTRRIHCFDKLDRLSDQQILAFQDLFLTPGIHHIDVESLADGRIFIHTFLGSFAANKHVACLTTCGEFLAPTIIRLYDDLALAGSLSLSSSLESFLLEEFYYDFVWVECTPELLATPWFWHFEQKLSDFNLDETLPILVVSYRNS